MTLKSYDDELEDKYYSYSINYYSNSYDQFDTINALVDNIKKSRRFDSEYGVIDKIKIYANEENIPYVFILGEDELAQNNISVKNMKEKKQDIIDIDNIIENFEKIK